MSDLHQVCKLSDIPENGKYPAFVEDEEVLIVKSGDKVFAIRDMCSHQDFPLAHGKVFDGKIKCKAHGAEFDLSTGKALCAPAHAPVATFPVEIRDGVVFIELK